MCVTIYIYNIDPIYAFSSYFDLPHICIILLSQLQHDSKTAENFKSASVDNSDGVAAVPPEPIKMFIHELN